MPIQVTNKKQNRKLKGKDKVRPKRKRKRRTKRRRSKKLKYLKDNSQIKKLRSKNLKTLIHKKMYKLKQIKFLGVWEDGKCLSNINFPTISFKDILLMNYNSIKFQGLNLNNWRQNKLWWKMLYRTWEKQLKFKDKSVDMPKELSSLDEDWSIFVRSFRITIESWHPKMVYYQE